MSWKRVNPDVLDRLMQKQTSTEKGIHFMVMVSPYTVPLAIKGEYNEERKIFEIRFRYLDEEETRPRREGEHVTFLEGTNSGRIMGIDVDVGKLEVSVIGMALGVVDESLRSHVPEGQQLNYDAAREVLNSTQEALLASVPA